MEIRTSIHLASNALQAAVQSIRLAANRSKGLPSMLFERRAYTLRPGRGPDFVASQIARGFDGASAGFMSRLLGYFETVAGPTDQIVHLYRYDSYDDWIEKLHGLYPLPEMQAYFRNTREFIREQTTEFFHLAPFPDASPLWQSGNDWLAGTGRRQWSLFESPDMIVEETRVALIPGGLPVYWSALAAHANHALGPPAFRLATWVALTGRLHTVRSYRIYPNTADRDTDLNHRQTSTDWQAFRQQVRSAIADETVCLMRPILVSEMSPLFEL